MPAKKRIVSPKVPEPPPRTWSNCLKIGNQVLIAGMTCREGAVIVGGDSMYGQSKAVFAKIANLLKAAGAAMDDVVKINVFVTDIARREEVWQARREFFSGDYPVSTLVEVSALAVPELLVEIEAQAIIGAAPKRRTAAAKAKAKKPVRPKR